MEQGAKAGSDEARERLNLALRASNEGIWDWWVGQREIYYSRRVLEFLECGEGSAPNLFVEVQRCIHEQDREVFLAKLRTVLEAHGPEIFAVDCRLLTGSGDWRWLRMRGAVVRDERGAAVRLAGSMIDISKRKKTEASLEEERHLLSLLINHVPLHVYFKDAASRFVRVNQSMAEWVGQESVDQMLGKHDKDFFGAAHWKQAEADEKEIMASGRPIMEMVERETWRGREDTWVMTSKFPWRNRSGEIKGIFGVSSDVSELVRAQRALEEVAEALHARNAEYEEELHLAREIQSALACAEFPTVVGKDGSARVVFGSRYVPISGMAGDFFEVFAISPERVGMLICDVMGHGVRSALVVAMLRGLIEKERGKNAQDPGRYLSKLNSGLASILHRAGVTMFATAFYVVIDFAAGEIRYASAGHPAAVVDQGGDAHELPLGEGKGAGLGLFAESSYRTERVPLAGVRQLLLFTDGLLEAENSKGELFLEKRLGRIVAKSSAASLEDSLDEIMARVLDFSGGHHFDDDVCMVAARFSGE
jgi:sigma-B regulation protein RsbU (phosphoserine phosphatase)